MYSLALVLQRDDVCFQPAPACPVRMAARVRTPTVAASPAPAPNSTRDLRVQHVRMKYIKLTCHFLNFVQFITDQAVVDSAHSNHLHIRT